MKKFVFGIFLLVTLAVLAACGGGSSTTPSDASGTAGATTASIKEGGLFRMGTISGPDTINPFVAFAAISYVMFTETYPTLVQYDEEFKITGDWAESWETSADGKTWTFKVKPGGKWSDGQPLTAKDAAYTGNLISKYAAGPTATLAPFLANAVKVEAPDDTTVVITYEKPVANVLAQLQQFFIMPQHVLEPIAGSDGKGLAKWAPEKALPIVGGGAFYIKQYDKKGTIILERNPGYYNTPPHLDAIGITIYQNADAMLAALKSGQLDTVDTVPPTLAKQYEADPNYQVQIGDSTFVYDIGFNSNPKKTDNKELLDPKVREALAHAVDRDQIIATVLNGYGAPATTMFTPISGDFANTDLPPETYDLALANQLLDDAGYARGADGTRKTSAGEKMEYEVIIPEDVEGVDRLFEILKTSWAEVGVNITQKRLDSTAAFEAIGAPDFKYLEFDIMLWDWVGYIDPDFMLSVVMCNQYGGWSDTAYCNPDYDKLYKEQGLAMDPAERKKIVWKMQEILYQDKPYIQVAQKKSITAYTKNWGGLTPPFLTGMSKIPWDSLHQIG